MGGGSGGGAADDPYLLQSLKGGHRNNAITSLAFAPQSERYIFSASTGDGSIMFWHVGGERSGGGGGRGQGAYALIKNRKRPVRFLGHERDVLALAHTEREGEGGRCASAGLDRSIRVWKATAYVFVRFFLFSSYFFFCSCCCCLLTGHAKRQIYAHKTSLISYSSSNTTGKESRWF
jgi:WD40 repeat protein